MALRFSDVLAEKFERIGQRFAVSVDTIWAMCKLQRCDSSSDQYFVRSLPLQAELEDRFDNIEASAHEAMDTTELTSSMIENLNRRVRIHIGNRQKVGLGFLGHL